MAVQYNKLFKMLIDMKMTNAELAEKATLKSAKEQAEKKLSESTDKMKEIANMFSTSLWKLMPQSIKKYFEEYRN